MPVPVLPQLLDIFCHLVIYFRAWVSQWSSTKPLFGASPLPCGFLKKCQQTIVECNPEVEVWFSHHATTFDELIGNKGGQIILALIFSETSYIYAYVLLSFEQPSLAEYVICGQNKCQGPSNSIFKPSRTILSRLQCQLPCGLKTSPYEMCLHSSDLQICCLWFWIHQVLCR